MFGTLATPPRAFLIGSALGLLPGIVVRVSVFAGAGVAVERTSDTLATLWIALGVAASAVLITLVGRAVCADLHRSRSKAGSSAP